MERSRCRHHLLSSAAGPLLALVCSLSCNSQEIQPLASITDVKPLTIEPRDKLQIRGEGFVEGSVDVFLQGDFKPAGLGLTRNCSLHIPAHAVREDLVEIPVTTRLMNRITTEPGRFEGHIELEFPSAGLGAIRITAKSPPINLALRPTGGAITMAATRFHEASRFLKAVGLTLLDGTRGDGLVVSEVDEASAAYRAGLKSGDRILAVDGAALANAAELAGASRSDSHRFAVVTRDGTFRTVELEMATEMTIDADEITALILSSIALGLFLAFAAPTRGRYLRLPERQSNPFTRAMGFGVVSAAVLGFAAVGMLSSTEQEILVPLVGLNVLGWTGIVLCSRMRGARNIAAFGAHLVPVPLTLALACASAPTLGLKDIVVSQQVTPWGWHAWSNPFALGTVLSSLALLWPRLGQLKAGNNRKIKFLTWLVTVPAAALINACTLGGWAVPGFNLETTVQSGALLALGCLLFLGKTWILIIVARRLAAVDIVERRSQAKAFAPTLSVAIPLVLAAASVFWAWSDLPAPFRTAGHALAMAAFVTFLTSTTVLGLKELFVDKSSSYLSLSPS